MTTYVHVLAYALVTIWLLLGWDIVRPSLYR